MVEPHHRQQYALFRSPPTHSRSFSLCPFVVAALSPPTLLSQPFQNPPWRHTANGNNMVELMLTYTPNCISFIIENSQITVLSRTVRSFCVCLHSLTRVCGLRLAVSTCLHSQQLRTSRNQHRHVTISMSNRHNHTLAAQTLASIRQPAVLPAHIRDLLGRARCQQR